MTLTSTYSVINKISEFQANSFVTGNQLSPDAVGLSNGGFVIAYNNGNIADGQVLVDFYNAAQQRVGTFEIPHDGGSLAMGQPQVVELANGNVLVSWWDNETGDAGRKGHLYTTGGEPIGGEINFTPGYSPVPIDPGVQVAALANGGFVTTYTADNHIYQARYTADGIMVGGGAFQVDSPLAGAIAADSAVAALSTGGYVVTYTDTDAADQTIRARIYGADGMTVVDDKIIASNGDNTQAKVVGLDGGNWAVVYTDTGWGDLDAGNSAITLEIFYAAGNSVSGFIRVNTPAAQVETEPDITVLDNGFIVVSWTKQFSATDFDIRARIFTPLGAAVTDSFSITTTGDTDIKSAIAGLMSGEFLTAWQDSQTDGDGGSITATVNEVIRTTVGNGDGDAFIGDSLRDIVTAGGGIDVIDGGAGNDDLFGEAANDTLLGRAGTDLLDGGIGADTLKGGAGNDTYIVDNAGDIVDESLAGSGGIDLVRSSVTFSFLNAAQVSGVLENLTLTGAGNVNATGNTLNNTLTGNAGHNAINGAVGADNMRGMAGNDTYLVDNLGDRVDESVAGSNGIDSVRSSVTFNLGAQSKGLVENVILTGGANTNALGNSLANVLIGNTGNNILAGGLGNDTLTGDIGNDLFLFNSAPNAMTNVDTITDMNELGNDTIRLENAIFNTLAVGALSIAEFKISSTGATQLDDRIIYNNVNGELSYDTNGLGAGGSTLIAILDPGLALTAADFVVV